MSANTNSPTPWRIESPSKGSPVPILHAANGDEVASVFGDGESVAETNAALIIKAVNAHAANLARIAELEGALTLAADRLSAIIEHDTDEGRPEDTETVAALNRARAILAKREG